MPPRKTEIVAPTEFVFLASITDQFSHHIERSKTRARFLPKTHCWMWIGPKNKNGYGLVYFEGKRWLAHRLSYWLKYRILKQKDRIFVCHTCDRPACVNPEHLFLATNQENSLDRIKYRTQLTLNEIAFIRNSTLPCAVLASQFKLKQWEIERLRPQTHHDRKLEFHW